MTENYKKDTLSYSALRAFGKSPNHYILYQEDRLETEAMIFGQAFHCYLLEFNQFHKRFAVAPEVDRRTKIGKETYAAFKEAQGQKKVLKTADMELIKVMAEAVMDNDRASELLWKAQYEMKAVGDIDNFPFVGIADIVNENIGFVADVKTCRDASPEAFMRDAYNSDYHLQAVIYKQLFQVTDFFWIAVEKERPHNVAVYVQSLDAERKALNKFFWLMDAWHKWDGTPQSYSDKAIELNLPRWA